MRSNRTSALAVAVMLALILAVSACAPGVHIYYSIDGTPHVLHDVRTEWDAPLSAPTPDTLPTVTPAPEPTATPEPVCTGTVQTTVRLNVRSGPGTGYGIVGTLQPGATVEIIGSAAGWYEIAAPSGWVSGQWVALAEVAACNPFAVP